MVNICWPSKPDPLRLLLPFSDSPGWRARHGVQSFHPCGRTSGYNYFLFCGLPTWWVYDLILLWWCPFLLSHCACCCVFGCRMSFLVGSRVFFFFSVNGFSAVSCDFDVLIRKDELMSFFSAILSWKLQCFYFYFFCPVACGIVVLWPGIEPGSESTESWPLACQGICWFVFRTPSKCGL